MDTDTATIMERLAAAGLSNIKSSQVFTAERPVSGASPDSLTVTIVAEYVDSFDPAEVTYTARAVRASDGAHTALANGSTVEDVISLLDFTVFD